MRAAAAGLTGLFTLTRGAALAVLALGAFAAGSASADPIGPNCSTCQGSIYTLETSPNPISTTATTQTFRITFTIDTSGYSGGGTGIDTVAVKVASSVVSTTLVDAPLGLANWSNSKNKGLNSSGCSGSGSGFNCSQVVSNGTVPDVGGTLVWKWNVEIANGTIHVVPFEASVKARYVDDDGKKKGDLVSEHISLQSDDPNVAIIPEPGTAALVGVGLLGIAARRGSRRS